MAIRWMSDCKCNEKLTQYPWKQGWLEVLILKKHSTLENTRSLQVASWNNDAEIMTVPLKYMAASALLKLQHALNKNICQIHCI